MSYYQSPIYVDYGIVPFGHVEWREQYPLVKASCHYNVEDVYAVAELVQDYYSSAPVDRQVEYVFPLPPDAAVCAFKAVIDDKKVIQGIVKEKEEAKKEYKKAIAAGRTAGLLEQQASDGEFPGETSILPTTLIQSNSLPHLAWKSEAKIKGLSAHFLRLDYRARRIHS